MAPHRNVNWHSLASPNNGAARAGNNSQVIISVTEDLRSGINTTQFHSRSEDHRGLQPYIATIILLPNEILLIILSELYDPSDLASFADSCYLFHRLTEDKHWFRLYRFQSPLCSQGVQLDHLSSSTGWRRKVLSMQYRSMSWLASPNSQSTSTKSIAAVAATAVVSSTTSNVVQVIGAADPAEGAECTAMDLEGDSPATPEFSATVDPENFVQINANAVAADIMTSLPSMPDVPGPVATVTAATEDSDSAGCSTETWPLHYQIPLDQTVQTSSLADEHLYLSLFNSPASSEPRWQNVGSPVSSSIPALQETVVAYMQAKTVKGVRDHQIVLYNPKDLGRRLATIASQSWTAATSPAPGGAAAHGWHYPFQSHQLGIAQVMDMKHFPETRDSQGRVRVLLVVVFGENPAQMGEETEGEMRILDTWLLVKIIEVYVHMGPLALTGHSVRRVQTLVPIQRQQVIRGRMVKLFRQGDPSIPGNQKRECLAIFGIRHVSEATAVLMTTVLFEDQAWDFQDIADGTSCMALFPANSLYSHLMVLFDQHGNGLVWNWARRQPVLALDTEATVVLEQGVELTLRSSTKQFESAPSGAVVIQERKKRDNLYFWGVQVNWAIEDPDLPLYGPREKGGFRVVALADGPNKEWQSCWWHLGEEMLNKHGGVDDKLTRRGDAGVTPAPSLKGVPGQVLDPAQGMHEEEEEEDSEEEESEYGEDSEEDEGGSVQEDQDLGTILPRFPGGQAVIDPQTQLSLWSDLPIHTPQQVLTNLDTKTDSKGKQAQRPIERFFRAITRLSPRSSQEPEPRVIKLQSTVVEQRSIFVLKDHQQQKYIHKSIKVIINPTLPAHLPRVECTVRYFVRGSIGYQGNGLSRDNSIDLGSQDHRSTPMLPPPHYQHPQHNKSLLYIAFLTWDNLRIVLTSQHGLCLINMDQEESCDVGINDQVDPPGQEQGQVEQGNHPLNEDQQCVVYLKDLDKDPLVDIATVGDSLYITRRYSIVRWSFNKVTQIQQQRQGQVRKAWIEFERRAVEWENLIRYEKHLMAIKWQDQDMKEQRQKQEEQEKAKEEKEKQGSMPMVQRRRLSGWEDVVQDQIQLMEEGWRNERRLVEQERILEGARRWIEQRWEQELCGQEKLSKAEYQIWNEEQEELSRNMSFPAMLSPTPLPRMKRLALETTAVEEVEGGFKRMKVDVYTGEDPV